MKTLFLLPILFWTLVEVHSQGTLRFTVNLDGASEVPSVSSSFTGFGWWTLTGTQLDGAVGVSFAPFVPTGGGIYGPALPGRNAPLLFAFGPPVEVQPFPPIEPGGIGFIGSFTLTQSQISELVGGRYYVNIMSAGHPNGEIRGQINLVPEPATLGLLSVGLGALAFGLRRRPMHNTL
jgi:hypothetical protein